MLFAFVFSTGVFAQAEPAFDFFSQFPKLRDFTMNASGDEAYFTIQSNLEEISMIAVVKKKNGKWLKPELAPFSGKYKDMEPFFSPDGLRLYFVSNRPLEIDAKETKDMDIWYLSRTTEKSDWSKPVNLGAPVNTKDDEFYPALALSGNIYFTKGIESQKGTSDIMFSSWDGEKYSAPVSLDSAINTEGEEYNAFIAPDESFLIFGGFRRPDGLGSGDLYISFKNPDGSWRSAVNLGGKINSKDMDYCPFVDMTSKTLYFTSRRSFVAPGPFETLNALEKEINRYENGQSRLYKVSIAEQLTKSVF